MTDGILISILVIITQIYLNSRKKGLNELVNKIEKQKGEILEPPVEFNEKNY